MSDSLNLTILDALCLSHAEHTSTPTLFPPPPHPPPPPTPTPTQAAAAAAFSSAASARAQAAEIAAVHAHFSAGAVDSALAAADALAPGALAEPRFQLDLRLHALVELVAAAVDGADRGARYAAALRYAREELAPYAQEAFAEAYELFARSMLIFVFPERAEGLEAKRRAIADRAAATLRARCGVKGSRLDFLVRYLAVVHCGKGSMYVSVSSSEAARAAVDWLRLLLGGGEGRIGGGDGAEGGCVVADLGEALLELGPRPLPHDSTDRSYTDAELLSLCDRIPGQSREDSLDSMRYTKGSIEAALLLELARVQVDASVLNDLVDDYLTLRGLMNPRASRESGSAARGHEMRRLRGVVETGDATRLVDAAAEIEPALLRGSPALQFRIGQAALVGELRAGNFGKSIDILRTTLGRLAFEHAELMPALRETSVLLAFPNDLADSLAPASPALPVKKRRTSGEYEHSDASGRRAFIPLRRSGDAVQDDVVEPALFMSNWNDDDDEMKLASVRASVLSRSSAAALAAPILRAVGNLGDEPRLTTLLARLLETHSNWLAASSMRADNFGNLLWLDRLTNPDDHCSEAARDGEPAGGQAGIQRNGGGADGSGERDPAREQKILTLREFLSMSRAESVSLLDEHPTLDVNGIIELIMGG